MLMLRTSVCVCPWVCVASESSCAPYDSHETLLVPENTID